jgi:hypothetical protein
VRISLTGAQVNDVRLKEQIEYSSLAPSFACCMLW